jgi:spore maturation protein A
MLNWIWGIMMIAGVAYGIVSGNTDAVGEGMMEGATEGISLAITMAAVLGLWCGLMEIAEKSGLLKALTKLLQPLIHFLFPKIPKTHKSLEYISVNFVANMFGLSGAATPSGLQAMHALEELEDERNKTRGEKPQKIKAASAEMCTFLVINISSLQLIPINLVAYRTQYGSVNPAIITAPALIATFVSTFVGILFCKIACHYEKS